MTDQVMLTASVGRLILQRSFPVIAGMLLYSLFSLADTFFISRLGQVFLAAFTLAVPLQLLLISLASATGVGLTSLIGRSLGNNKIYYADNIAWHGVCVSLIYGLVFIWLGRMYLGKVLVFFNSSTEISIICHQYLSIILWGSPFIFLPIILGNIIQGEGDTLSPMLISLAGISLSVALDPIFIFGWGPIPGLQLNGAAIATVLSHVVVSILLVVLLQKKRRYLSWDLHHFRPSLTIILDIYQVGIPALFMELTGVGLMIIINRIVAGYGYTAIAVLGVFLHLRSFVLMPVHGLAQGIMPIAAFAYGAAKLDRIKEIMVKSGLLAIFLTGLGWLGIQLYPEWLIGFFSLDSTLNSVGTKSLVIGTCFIPLTAPTIILSTVLQALGRGFTAMILSLIKQIGFLLPLLLFLPRYYGLDGIWAAFTGAELAAALLTALVWFRFWRQLQVPGNIRVATWYKPKYLLRRLWAWWQWN